MLFRSEFLQSLHCKKNVRTGVFCSGCSPLFEMNTKFTNSKFRKLQTRKKVVLNTCSSLTRVLGYSKLTVVSVKNTTAL